MENKINIAMKSLPKNYFGPDESYNQKRKKVQKAMFPQNDPNYIPPGPLTNIEKRAKYWSNYQKAKNAGEFNTNNNNNNNKTKKRKNANKQKYWKSVKQTIYGPRFNAFKEYYSSLRNKTRKNYTGFVNGNKNNNSSMYDPENIERYTGIVNSNNNNNNNNNPKSINSKHSSQYDPKNIERYTGIVNNFNLPLKTSNPVYVPKPLNKRY